MVNNNVIAITLKVLDNATKQLNSVSWGIDSWAKKNEKIFWTMAAVWWATFWIMVWWISQTINKASELWESINAVNVVFWQWSKEILEFWKTAAQTIWLSKKAFNELAVPIGALLQNTWLWFKEATSNTIELGKRAADMASIFNVDVTEALGAIQAWLRGEADPLERFWVWLNETAVKAYALRNGLIASWKEMTAQEKMTARLWLLYEQTSKYQWDFANTSDWLANSKRILNANIENITATIGNSFVPVLEKITSSILPIVTKIGEWVEKNPELTQVILVTTVSLAWLVAWLWVLWLAIPTVISWIKWVAAAISFLWWPLTILIALIWVLAYTIYSNRDGIKQGTSDFVEAIGIYWDALWTNLTTIWMRIKQNLTEILVRGTLWVLTLWMSEFLIKRAWWWDNVVTYVRTALNPMVEFVSWIFDKISWFITKIKTGISSIWWSSLMSSITWNRAIWGPVVAWQPYMVWERWREIFIPSTNGRISTQWSSSPSVSISIWNVHIKDQNDMNYFMNEMENRIRRSISNNSLYAV